MVSPTSRLNLVGLLALGGLTVLLLAGGAPATGTAPSAGRPHAAAVAPPANAVSSPYGTFVVPSAACSAGTNGTCPQLVPSISVAPSTICMRWRPCPGSPYDARVTLNVSAKGSPISYPPNVQVVFVVETTPFDGVYDPGSADYGGSSPGSFATGGPDDPCHGPCMESNGVPFFVANAGVIASNIAAKYGASLNSCHPGSGQNSVCFALVDYFADCTNSPPTACAGDLQNDADGSEYNVDLSSFVPATTFGTMVSSMLSSGTLFGSQFNNAGCYDGPGAWVNCDSDFSDNLLDASSITALYGALRGSGLAWDPTEDHAVVLMTSSAPRDPAYQVEYAPTYSTWWNQGPSVTCEPAYTFPSGLTSPPCVPWVGSGSGSSIAGFARASNITVNVIDLPNGATLVNSGDYNLSTGTLTSEATTDVHAILQSGCDMAVATGGFWEGPSGFPCSAAPPGSGGQGNLTMSCTGAVMGCVPPGQSYAPPTSWASDPGLGWALSNIQFPYHRSNIAAKNTQGGVFQFIPTSNFAIDTGGGGGAIGTPNYAVKCSSQVTPNPPCVPTPYATGLANGGVSWSWPYSQMSLNDTWQESFNLVTGPGFSPSLVGHAIPVDACVIGPPNPWRGCQGPVGGSFAMVNYTRFDGTSLVQQSFPPGFVTVVTLIDFPPPPPPPPRPPPPPPPPPGMPVLNPVNVPLGNPLANPLMTPTVQSLGVNVPQMSINGVFNVGISPVSAPVTGAWIGAITVMGVGTRIRQRRMVAMRMVVKRAA